MKLSFLSLCFSAVILFSSCTKEAVPPNGGNQTNYPTPAHVTVSDWINASAMVWTDETATSNDVMVADWQAQQLNQEVVDNNAVLIYAKTSDNDEPKLLPALFESGNNNELNEYRSILAPGVIQLFHTTQKEGAYTRPSVNGNVSFRYIVINNLPPANARIITSSGAEYELSDLRLKSYNEVVALLGISE